MRKGFFIILLILAVFQGAVFSQKPGHFYNVDTEKKIRGTIQRIVMESRYKDVSPFLIVVLEEKKTEEVYNVEISPARFFTHDLQRAIGNHFIDIHISAGPGAALISIHHNLFIPLAGRHFRGRRLNSVSPTLLKVSQPLIYPGTGQFHLAISMNQALGNPARRNLKVFPRY